MSDSYFFFYLLLALTVCLISIVFVRSEKIYEYPYFMAAVFLSFILPQALSLLRFPGDAPAEAVATTLLMSCLALAMCCVGYGLGGRGYVPRVLYASVSRDRMAYGGLVFTVIAYVFSWLILQMSEEETGGSTWTGRVTIYAFFSQLIYPGFSILLLTALRNRSLFWWSTVAFAAVPPLYSSVFGGRRESTVLFVLTIALTLLFHRKARLKRWMIALGIILATAAIPATGIYRAIATEREWYLLKEFSLLDNFKNWLSQEQSVLELRNAAMVINVISDTHEYSLGLGYWDELVWRFVPAQWVGEDFKRSLMFTRADEGLDEELFSRGYEISTGSTVTGIADSFREFGYVGCVVFAIIGAIFRRLWRVASEGDNFVAQVFYIQISTSAMRTITHQTVDFFPAAFYHFFFLGLLAFVARAPAMPSRLRIEVPKQVV